MLRKPFFILGLLVMLCSAAFAQLTTSNVYLFDLKRVGDSTYTLAKPRYVTSFNATGYNNHPWFFSNTELFMSVQLPGEAQPELYSFDLEKMAKTKITSTREGEFSPMRMPDYYNFSSVRMTINDRDTLMQLWQFPMDRTNNGRPVFKYLNKIGYYAWINSARVAVYMVDKPQYLAIADIYTDKIETIATNTGRCLRILPNGNLVYVQKSNVGPWQIMEKNTYQPGAPVVAIVETLPGVEDFAILPDGGILMAKGSRIYKYNRSFDTRQGWTEIADLRHYDIDNISRIAISSDFKVAVVAN